MLHLFQSTLESRLRPDLQSTLWHQGKDAKAKRKKRGKMTSAKLSLWLSGRPLTSVCQRKAEVEQADTAGLQEHTEHRRGHSRQDVPVTNAGK